MQRNNNPKVPKNKNKITTLRVCLLGGKTGWMKNFGGKIGRKTFLECVWLSGKEGR